MKKLLFCMVLTVAVAVHAVAQEARERKFKRFKGDVSAGFAAPLGSNTDGGILFSLEPKFAVLDNLALGLRMEGAVMANFRDDNRSYGDIDDARLAGSYVATADYYFSNNYSFRPFVGAGAGVYSLVTDETYNNEVVTSVKPGGIIRAGGEVKHFRFALEFNIVPTTTLDSYIPDNQGNPVLTRTTFKNGYIGIKAGFCFGGGPLHRD